MGWRGRRNGDSKSGGRQVFLMRLFPLPRPSLNFVLQIRIFFVQLRWFLRVNRKSGEDKNEILKVQRWAVPGVRGPGHGLTRSGPDSAGPDSTTT